MFTLAELALAHKITGEAKYVEAIADLMEIELGDDMGAKEYIVLTPGQEGGLFPRTFPYSWNALAYQALKWAGLQ